MWHWRLLCFGVCGCGKGVVENNTAELLEVTPRFTKLVLETNTPVTRTVSFKLKNLGKASLRVTGVRPSCGCTVAGALRGLPVLSGEIATFDVMVSLPQTGKKISQLSIDYVGSERSSATATLELHRKDRELPYAGDAAACASLEKIAHGCYP
jgi:hypothetical protein